MSTQERRELAGELERSLELAAMERGLMCDYDPPCWAHSLIAIGWRAAAALRGEQPVESGQREPSDVAFKLRARALSLTPLMPGSGFQGSPDDIRLMEAASDEIERLRGVVRLARLAGGQNS
jgi:hypothetical protein